MSGAPPVLPDGYLRYPHRGPGPGLDHDWFDRRFMTEAEAVRWPGGATLALWITIDLEHFPMDMPGRPFVPTGGMLRPYPSYWDYTQRDYGNRVGIHRIVRALDRFGLAASVAANAEALRRYPALAELFDARRWEIVASGVDMGCLHHGDLAAEDEAVLIERSVTTLRALTGQAVTGWHSPANSCSMHTHGLLPGFGIRYVTDWINDELPFPMRTRGGPLLCLPRNMELSDKTLLVERAGTRADYAAQVLAAARFLLDEAGREGARILSLSLSPWVTGQPWCIATLEAVLADIVRLPGIWCATGGEILHAWERGQADAASSG